MTTISNGESGLSVRNKLNDIWAGLELNEIDTSIAATAVDVFVYDTSKDSDGGAWRKRTQHTSWYNETLNTATRGSRREFPAVAVIVAEADKVTIYDGDDPTLPMWMVANRTDTNGSPSWIGANNTSEPNGIAALNGIISIASDYGSTASDWRGGVTVVDFVGDKQTRYNGPSVSNQQKPEISTRNIYTGYINISGDTLVHANTNDVAMTVLPDAPIDPATGIPVPTIAVATDGGVSVIKDDGTVVDSASTQSTSSAIFCDAGLYYIAVANNAFYFATFEDIAAGDGFGDNVGSPNPASGGILMTSWGSKINPTTGNDFSLAGSSLANPSVKNGLMLHSANVSNFDIGMSALATSTYNTGYMNGDIKGAFLSDTDDTDLVGSGELVTNGTFDTDFTGWSDINSPTKAVVSGEAEITGDAFDGIVQDVTVVSGSLYQISLDITSKTGAVGYAIYSGANASGAPLLNINNPTTGVKQHTIAATTNIFSVVVWSRDTAVTFTVDNVSVKLADEDRSVNANGLIVNGTVTRTPVATGADLVAYSGFSA